MGHRFDSSLQVVIPSKANGIVCLSCWLYSSILKRRKEEEFENDAKNWKRKRKTPHSFYPLDESRVFFSCAAVIYSNFNSNANCNRHLYSIALPLTNENQHNHHHHHLHQLFHGLQFVFIPQSAAYLSPSLQCHFHHSLCVVTVLFHFSSSRWCSFSIQDLLTVQDNLSSIAMTKRSYTHKRIHTRKKL